MKIVVSLGGSLLTREFTPQNFKKYADVLKRLKRKNHKLVVVVGGGKICRDYRDIAKEFTLDNVLLDWVGIQTTHLNAFVLIAALGKNAHPMSLRTVEEVKRNFNDKILVCGGNLPGCSTGYDAALFAEAIKADLLIKASDVDGVYSTDPDLDPNAKKYDKLTHDEFLKIIEKNPQVPGEYRLFDLKAARLIKKNKIKTIFVDGTDPEEIIRTVEGKHHGTVIES
ncbi:MAG: UMP kinase [Candidatus Aenigmarchaeota archaeon]|nr:UMP kinase [Candidatus Aenigmarchaeota archaeon]